LIANPQKRKGDDGERQVAKILSDMLGENIRRALGAGRKDDVGDLHGLVDVTGQVKTWSNITSAINVGLRDLARQQKNSGDRYGVLFVKRRSGWIVVMEVPTFVDFYKATRR